MAWAEQPHDDGGAKTIDVELDDTGDIDVLDVDDTIAARIAAGSVTLPAFPSILADLGSTQDVVASIVERDVGLVAAIVRIVESEGIANATVVDAVAYLGAKRLNKIALACALAKTALAPGPLLDVRRRVWRSCIAGALVAEAIADDHGVAADVAFVAGLLHDFGQIVALALIEEIVVDAKPGDPTWLDVVERHHCDLGQMLAESWSLPQPIPAVIGGHHQRLHSGRIAILDVVHAVDDIVAALNGKRRLTLDEIEALPIVTSRAQAALVLLALDRLPAFAAALAPPSKHPPPSPPPSEGDVHRRSSIDAGTTPSKGGGQGGGCIPIGAIALEKPVRVALRTAILGQARIEGLTTTMVSRTALAVTSKHPLPKGWVTRLEIAGPRGAFTVWVSVVASKQERGIHYAEAKPMALHAGADGWPAFVDALRVAA